MCFVCWLTCWFLARNSYPMLLPYINFVFASPVSLDINVFVNTASYAHSANAMYSASRLDSVTIFCF